MGMVKLVKKWHEKQEKAAAADQVNASQSFNQSVLSQGSVP
jgi:hypothetical protein